MKAKDIRIGDICYIHGITKVKIIEIKGFHVIVEYLTDSDRSLSGEQRKVKVVQIRDHPQTFDHRNRLIKA